MSSRIKTLLRPELRKLSAYRVQPSAGLIKLDAMENPYSLPADLQARWLESIGAANLNRYPDAAAAELRQQIKSVYSLPQQAEVMLGNGSDELIQLLCLALINAPTRSSGQPVVMAPEPGFAMYRQLATATGLDYVPVSLRANDFALDMPAMLQALERYKPELLFLAYPNNPTGNLFSLSDCEQLIKNAPGLVVFDEAYHPFAESSAVDFMRKHENVLLMRTFSKLGLAGIRLGILAGSESWMLELEKLRLPYNINVLTQVTAEFACQNYEIFLQQSEQIRIQRQQLYAELGNIESVKPYDSKANFILFSTRSMDASKVFAGLLEQGVLIKDLSQTHPLLKNCLRVTIGTPEENNFFISALKKLL